MTEDTTRQSVPFPGLFEKPLAAKSNRQHDSSDGGAVLLKACDDRLGPTGRLAACIG